MRVVDKLRELNASLKAVAAELIDPGRMSRRIDGWLLRQHRPEVVPDDDGREMPYCFTCRERGVPVPWPCNEYVRIWERTGAG